MENRVNSSVCTDILKSHLLPRVYLCEIVQQHIGLAQKNFYMVLENGDEIIENLPTNSSVLNIIEIGGLFQNVELQSDNPNFLRT